MLFEAPEHGGRLDLKRARQPKDGHQARLPLPPFEHPHVRPVDPASVGELFPGEPASLAEALESSVHQGDGDGS